MMTRLQYLSNIPVKLVKLITGENLLCALEVSDDEEFIRIYEPILIYVSVVPGTDSIAVNTLEWLPSVIVKESTAEIHTGDVMAIVDVSDKYLDLYSKILTSKLANQEELLPATEEAKLYPEPNTEPQLDSSQKYEGHEGNKTIH